MLDWIFDHWYLLIVGVLLIAVLLFCIFGIRSCAICHELVKTAEQNGQIVSVRYFMNPDFVNSEVVLIRVEKGADFKLERIPQCEGYLFLGLYDGQDPTQSTLYVDASGYSMQKVTEDVLLYPCFMSLNH